MKLLELQDVGVSYERGRRLFGTGEVQQVFQGLSFSLHQGDSLGVIGNNGVGKSTLLRLMAGIIDPDEGKVINHGAKTALMSLAGGYYAELSGRQNILLGGVLLGFSEAEVREKFDDIIAFSELGKNIDKPVNTYSAGMKARLNFSRAAMLQADILLIDEVLAVGDKNFREKCEELMRQRISSEQTVVYVSHNEKSVAELCSQVLWIDKGAARALGPSADIVEQYLAS
jgi:lipopolysaccharide transport system ATP-binding protein